MSSIHAERIKAYFEGVTIFIDLTEYNALVNKIRKNRDKLIHKEARKNIKSLKEFNYAT